MCIYLYIFIVYVIDCEWHALIDALFISPPPTVSISLHRSNVRAIIVSFSRAISISVADCASTLKLYKNSQQRSLMTIPVFFLLIFCPFL